MIVVDEMDGGRRPIGFVTDWDIVAEIISASKSATPRALACAWACGGPGFELTDASWMSRLIPVNLAVELVA